MLFVVAALGFSSATLAAANAYEKSAYFRSGKAAFARKDYRKAIKFFRAHLLKFTKDYDSWNYMAMSYYHAGLPKRALKYLRKVESKTESKSLNYLYRGLALLSLNRKRSAIKMLKKSSKSHGQYKHEAIYELALIYYHDKDFVRAKKWCRRYLSKYAKKSRANQSKHMCRSIDTGTYIAKLEGIAKPKLTSTKFKYSILSLFNFPHFWITQLGFEAYRFDGSKPGSAGEAPRPHLNVVSSIVANFGLGLGPFRMEAFSFWLSYIYGQMWNTDPGRLILYFSDPLDVPYFPFRPDLLLRSHRVSSGITAKFSKRFNLGVYSDVNISYIGTSLVTEPDGRSSLKGKVRTKTSILTLPWLGISIHDVLSTYLYAYFEIADREDTDFSSKTYSFNPANPTLGFGVRNIADLKKLQTEIKLDFYFLPYLHNDSWLNFLRLGGALEVRTEPINFLSFSSRYIFLYDRFELRLIKTGSCDPREYGQNKQLDSTEVKICDHRQDLTHSFEIGSALDFSNTKRIHLLGVLSFTGSSIPYFTRRDMKLMINFSWAFPSAEKSLNYVNKFADTVYLIGREDYGYVR